MSPQLCSPQPQRAPPEALRAKAPWADGGGVVSWWGAGAAASTSLVPAGAWAWQRLGQRNEHPALTHCVQIL